MSEYTPHGFPLTKHHDGYVWRGQLPRLYGECEHCLLVNVSGFRSWVLDPGEPEADQKRAFFLELARHIADEHGVVEPRINVHW